MLVRLKVRGGDSKIRLLLNFRDGSSVADVIATALTTAGWNQALFRLHRVREYNIVHSAYIDIIGKLTEWPAHETPYHITLIPVTQVSAKNIEAKKLIQHDRDDTIIRGTYTSVTNTGRPHCQIGTSALPIENDYLMADQIDNITHHAPTVANVSSIFPDVSSSAYAQCLARCTTRQQPAENFPSRIRCLQTHCPGSACEHGCSKTEHEWDCFGCKNKLKYADDGQIYCDCGKAPLDSYEFRCNDVKHGDEFVAFQTYLRQPTDNGHHVSDTINVLILGETGVGKSTFINAIANYIAFATLDEAISSSPLFVIPSQFHVSDASYQTHAISTGGSFNEDFTDSQSSTQHAMSHVFEVNGKHLRLIDTPGILDTRGVEQDRLNFANTLRYISNLKELHAICILLKPNTARLSLIFQYCINELLASLDKSAVSNIIICFTNARGTYYRPGDTLPIMQQFFFDLKSTHNVDISLRENNLYCFDNEAYRFICEQHSGITRSPEDKQKMTESWERSKLAFERMIRYVFDLTPYPMQQLTSINEINRKLSLLAKPLATVVAVIEANWRVLLEAKRELELVNEANRIRQVKLPCFIIETQKLENAKLECESCGRFCKKILTTGYCQTCNCHWSAHHSMQYVFETREVKLENNLTGATQDAIHLKHILLTSAQNRIDSLRDERRHIIFTLVAANRFLRTKSLVPIEDKYEGYLLRNARNDAANSHGSRIHSSFQQLLDDYRKQREMFSRSADFDKAVPQADYIVQLLQSLFALQIFGASIQQMFAAEVDDQNETLMKELKRNDRRI